NSSNEPKSELNERTAIFAERPCSITTDFADAHPLFGDVAKLEDDGVAAGLYVSFTLTRSPSTMPSGALSITRSSGDSPDAISIVLPRSQPIVIDFKRTQSSAPTVAMRRPPLSKMTALAATTNTSCLLP